MFLCDSQLGACVTDGMNTADAVLLCGDGRKLGFAVQWQINQLIFTRFTLQDFPIIAQRCENFAGMQCLAAVVASNDETFSHQNTNVPSTRQFQNIFE